MGKNRKRPPRLSSKNLSNAPVISPIGWKTLFRRERSSRSLKLADIVIEAHGIPQNLEPKPIGRIRIMKKEKSVHMSKAAKLGSIDNDQLIKGRPIDPRRPGFPRQQGSEEARHEDRPRAADRGKRQQVDKDTRDGEQTARSINSAPSKDREAPVPKLNSFMKEEKSEKDAMNRDRQALEKAKLQTHIEKKPPDKTLLEGDKAPMKDKGRLERPKENDQKENDRKANDRKENDRKENERKDNIKRSNLPPDDHGPAFITATEEDNNQEDPEQFKYYASVNATPRQKPVAHVPPLQLHTKRPVAEKNETGGSVTAANNTKSKSIIEEMDNKKKREVTIVDPKDLKRAADEIVEEAFRKEYEYAHNEERRAKDFEEMDEDEKIDFFKSQYRMKPEQIRELTFHPKTNEPKIIHKTYTGIDTADWELAPDSARIKSGRRPKSRHSTAFKKVMVIPTYQRKDFVLSRLQGKIYHHISKVYGSSPRDNREKQFYEKLAQIQLDEYRRRYDMLERNERKRLESLFRQREQLKQLRKKFEKDAWRRFMTQYVTSKVVESELSNRKEYGLPNTVDKDVHARRKKLNEMDPSTKDRLNRRRFEHLFKFSTGPDLKVKGKPLKFEGIDTVYIDTEDDSDATRSHTGNQVSHRQDVAQLIKEARLLLSQTEMGTGAENKQRYRSDKQPSRPIHDTRDRLERPHHHHTRVRRQTESDQTPLRRSKSRIKTAKTPKPKTIKDVILRRQSQPANRYKMSEFLRISNKTRPTRGSNENLNKDTTSKRSEVKKQPEKSVQRSVNETTEETVRLMSVSSNETDKQTRERKPSLNKITKADTGKADKDIMVNDAIDKVRAANETKQEKQRKVEQKPHMFLEETETLIGTSRDYDASSPVVKQTVSKKTVSRSESPVSRAGLPSRPVSKASIMINNNVGKSPSISKGYISSSRRESKASVQIQNGNKSEIPYKQPIPKRTQSVASILSKANSTAQQNDKQEGKDTMSVKDKEFGKQSNKVPDNARVQRTLSRSSLHTVNSIYKNDSKPNKRESKTSINLQNVVDKVIEKEKVHESQNTHESRTRSVQNSTANLKKASNSKQVSPSPSRASKVGTPKKIDINYDKSNHAPSVNRNVHISETVEVHLKTHPSKKDIESHSKKVVENGLPDNSLTNVDEKRQNEQANGQEERNPSPKPSQARSKLREGKGPIKKKGKGKHPAGSHATQDKRDTSPVRKAGKTRFPDIERNDKTVSNNRTTPKPHTTKTSAYDEVETETIRTVTPSEKHGAAKWKDLVQKYLREPSPVVGKREDLSVLQTKVESDDSGSEADIFERARRRYALDVDEDSDED